MVCIHIYIHKCIYVSVIWGSFVVYFLSVGCIVKSSMVCLPNWQNMLAFLWFSSTVPNVRW